MRGNRSGHGPHDQHRHRNADENADHRQNDHSADRRRLDLLVLGLPRPPADLSIMLGGCQPTSPLRARSLDCVLGKQVIVRFFGLAATAQFDRLALQFPKSPSAAVSSSAQQLLCPSRFAAAGFSSCMALSASAMPSSRRFRVSSLPESTYPRVELVCNSIATVYFGRRAVSSAIAFRLHP